ncbi:MAG: phosphate acyltransferase PlsX [Planctomycetaceae bacterium]|nr:phosphate acyltransferase PlsX [Planctomycetaceae bacterium]
MRIALDAMGGDDAPSINVDGAILAVQSHPDLEVLLVGDEPILQQMLADRGWSGDRLIVVAADGAVGMDEKPVDALRKKPKCSIAVCWKLMATQQVDAVVSAGNTGAVVAAGLWTRLFLKGVKRPGIAVTLPTLTGGSVLMDVGANPGARTEHLYQYGIMGSIYAQHILGIENPRIGLMNIGTEEGKGNELARETHQYFMASRLKNSYVGNVEGRGLYEGEADVLICEGFVGNVVLKVSEGIASMMMKMLAGAVLKSLDQERDRAKAAFEAVSKSFEHNEVGGAPLLGIDGICLIGHGSSDARSIVNALKGAMRLKNRHINDLIVEQLAAQSGGE